jgi:pimeloyl-ACP methyl ester carboxylesterase
VVAICLLRRFLRAACIILAASVVLLSAGDASYAQAQAPSANARRPIIFVPGMLGSRLCRDNPANPAEPILAWGSIGALTDFPNLRIGSDVADDLKPCGVIREIVFLGPLKQELYAPIINHLEKIGYREGADLFIFDYDWRRSVFDNAARLETFAREKIPDPAQRFDIVAHSMGGLIARVYVNRHGGAQRVARLFSAGSPFQGSVKVYATLEKGWGALNSLMGGLPAFRRTVLSFPSAYELAPRYGDCCEVGAGQSFALAESDAWRALKWDGVDPTAMADLKIVASRAEELRNIVATPLPDGIEDVVLIGVDQRTPQRIVFEAGEAGTIARVRTTWEGDGTVLRSSATLNGAFLHPTSFATHEKILSDPQIQQFLQVALTRDVAQAMRSVPVRPRGKIETSDGKFTDLVGIVVEPDETVYRAGQTGRVRVHVRLGNTQKLRPGTIKMTGRRPDGRDVAIMLKPDPAASAPGNPFEQSFAGQFNAGAKPGIAVLKAVVPLSGGARVVEQPVAVIAK